MTCRIRPIGWPFLTGSIVTVTSSPALNDVQDHPRGVIDVGLCVSTAQFRIVPVPSFVIDCPGNVSQSIAGGDSVSTVAAVYGGVNKLESSIFPSLHHRREAQARQRAASRRGGRASRKISRSFR